MCNMFKVNFEHISHLVSIVNFEQLNASWRFSVLSEISYGAFFFKKNKKWLQGVMFFSQKSCMIDVSPGSKYVYEAILVNQ